MELLEMTTTLPAWTRGERDERGLLSPVEGMAVWSNDSRDPPAIGDQIEVGVNRIGKATVLAYFVEAGFLGLKVEVEKWPPVLDQMNGDNRITYVFGREIL